MRHSRIQLAGVAAVLMATAAVGCKTPTWRKQKADAEAARNERQRVTRTAQDAAPQYFDVDDKSGRSKSALVLRLDYFPEARPGAAALPVCFAPFEAEFELGYVMCEGQADSQRPLTAANVDQDCYTDSRRGRISAIAPVTLPGCRRGVVTAHQFEPPLRLDVELRDVN